MCVCVCAQACKMGCQICSLHSDSDRLTLCSCVTHTERDRGAGREPTSLLVIQLMDYVLFKWHRFSSAKTTLKPHFIFFINVQHISVLPKIDTATMSVFRGLSSTRTSERQLIFWRSEVDFLFFELKQRSQQMKNIIVSSNFVSAFSCDNCLLSMLLSTRREMPQTGVIGVLRTASSNNCNYQKWLVSWKQSRMSFCVWVRGSDASGTLGNSTLQLIFNTLQLIVFIPAAAPAELLTRWCGMNLWVFFFLLLQ